MGRKCITGAGILGAAVVGLLQVQAQAATMIDFAASGVSLPAYLTFDGQMLSASPFNVSATFDSTVADNNPAADYGDFYDPAGTIHLEAGVDDYSLVGVQIYVFNDYYDAGLHRTVDFISIQGSGVIGGTVGMIQSNYYMDPSIISSDALGNVLALNGVDLISTLNISAQNFAFGGQPASAAVADVTGVTAVVPEPVPAPSAVAGGTALLIGGALRRQRRASATHMR